MQVGEHYDPWGAFRGPMIPLGVAGMGITPTAKLVFGMLAYYARDGQSWPSRDELKDKCDISLRAVGTALTELAKAGLIVEAGRFQRKVIYEFPWHQALEGSVRKSPTSVSRSEQNLPGSTLGSEQNVPTTPETNPAESADDDSQGEMGSGEAANRAESARDSEQNLPEIMSRICPLQGGIHITSLPEPYRDPVLPPRGTSVERVEDQPGEVVSGGLPEYSPTASEGESLSCSRSAANTGAAAATSLQRDRASPFDSQLFEDLRELIPRQAGDDNVLGIKLNQWLAKVGKVEVRTCMSLLETTIRERRVSGSWVNWLESTIEKRRLERANGGSSGNSRPKVRSGL